MRCKKRSFKLARGLLAFFFAFTLLPAASVQGGPPNPAPDRRFGIVEAFWSPGQATEIGVGWERVLFWWKSLQPSSPEDWNPFYFPDDTVAQEISQGREIVGLLISTPPWASDSHDPRVPPKNLYLPYDHPDNYWGAFVKKIAERYRGRIDTWIVWNEPDVWDAQRSMSTWLGSEADYYQLLKVAYQSAKSVNPSAKIVFGGLTYWWDKSYNRELYLKRVLDIAANDPTARANGYYFDVANVHLYSQPDQLYTVPRQFRQVLAAYGLSKPIWVSEMNVVPHDDPVSPLPRADFRANLEEQASYVIQASALSIAGGVERIALYKMRDDTEQPPNSEAYGLTRKDGTARPSFAALRAATKHLSGAREARWFTSKDLNAVVVQRNGEVSTVLWNNGPRPVTATLKANGPQGLLVDKSGMAAQVAPSDGKYMIILPASTSGSPADGPQSYFIGGDPFILVEVADRAGAPLASPFWEPPALPARVEEPKATPTKDAQKEEQARAEQERVDKARLVEIQAEQRKALDEAKLRERVATMITQTQQAIDRYDWQIASARLQELSEIDPQNPKGRELQALLQKEIRTLELRSRAAELYRLQDWQGAALALRQLYVLYPEDAMLRAQLQSVLFESENAQLLLHAEQYVKKGRWDEAQQVYDFVLSRDPRNRRALDGVANVQYLRWSQSWNRAVP